MRKMDGIAIVFILSVIVYILIITIGRINVRGLGELKKGVYYAYVYAALCLPLIVSLLDTEKLKDLLVTRWRKILLLIAIMGALGYCFIYTLSKNVEGYIRFSPQREFLVFVNQLVRQHKSEPQFSFSVAGDTKGNYVIPWFINDHNHAKYSFAQAVYARFYKEENYQYRISFDKKYVVYKLQPK